MTRTTKKRLSTVARWLRRGLYVGLVLCLAGAGGWLWLDRRVEREVREKIGVIAGRLGMTAVVDAVALRPDGTVVVGEVELRGAGTRIVVRDVRVEVDPWESLRTWSAPVIRRIQVADAGWHEAGDPGSRAVLTRLREVVRSLRHGGVRTSRRLQMAPGRLPAVVVENATLSTDEGTLVAARGAGNPQPDGAYDWQADGRIDLAVFETSEAGQVGFRARGHLEAEGAAAGRVHVELSRSVSLAGPRGTVISGIRSVTYANGSICTGPAVVRDRAGTMELRLEGMDVDVGALGTPSGGRFGAARLLVRGQHHVEAEDLRFEPAGSGLVMSNARVHGPAGRGSVAEVTYDIRSGVLAATKMSGTVKIGGRELRFHADRATARIGRPGAWPDRVRFDAVQASAGQAALDASLLELTLDASSSSWAATGRGVNAILPPAFREQLPELRPDGRVQAELVSAAGRLVEGALALDLARTELRLEGVRARSSDMAVSLREVRLARSELSALGTVLRKGGGRPVPVEVHAELDAGLRPLRGRIALRGVPLAWAPPALVRRLGLGQASLADVRLAVEPDNGSLVRFRVHGQVAFRDLTVSHWRLAPDPVGPVSLDADLDLSVDREAETLDLALRKLRVGKARADLSVSLRGFGPRPDLDIRVRIPQQDCSQLVQAVPMAMRPALEDLRVEGTAWMDARMTVPLTDTSRLRLRVDGDMAQCRIVTLGKALDRKVALLKSASFVHEPVVAGEAVGVRVGPGTRSWVPWAEIPELVRVGAIVTEDRAFLSHEGFRTSLIRGALKLNLDHMRYVYGGSTITQQLVKNLFLTRRKDLARKLEEAAIVVQLERTLDKQRILELYLNCIEYGPGIWSLSEAAAVYFGKRAQDLTPLQGAYLMALKPYPRYGFYTAKRNFWTKRWTKRMRVVLTRIHRAGAIDQDTLEALGPDYRPVFAGLHPKSAGTLRARAGGAAVRLAARSTYPGGRPLPGDGASSAVNW